MRKILFFVIIIFFSIYLLCYQYPNKGKEFTYGNLPGNIAINGRAAFGDGYIFFNNILDISSDESGKLYKLNTKNNDLTRLCDDSAYYINILGNWVYYNNSSDNNFLYRISTDGSQREKILDEPVQYLNIVNDQIYYYDYQRKQIVNTDLEGSQKEILISNINCSNLLVYEDSIYYIDLNNESNLYRMSVKGKKQSTLINKNVRSFSISDGAIYFQLSLEPNIYRIKISEKNSLIEDLNCKAQFFNVKDNWIYFYENGLYKTNGTESIKLSSTFENFIYICDDWIYGFSGLSLSNRAISKIKIDGAQYEKSKLNEYNIITVNDSLLSTELQLYILQKIYYTCKTSWSFWLCENNNVFLCNI